MYNISKTKKCCLIALFIVLGFFFSRGKFSKELIKDTIKVENIDMITGVIGCSKKEVIYGNLNGTTVFYNLDSKNKFEVKDMELNSLLNDEDFVVKSDKGVNIVTSKGEFLFEDWKEVITGVSKDLVCVDGEYLFNIKDRSLKHTGEIMLSENDGVIPCIDRKSKKIGYFNEQGEMIIPVKYDSGSYFKHGYAVVEENGNIEIIDKDSNIIYKEGLESCQGIQIVSLEAALVVRNGEYSLDFFKENRSIKNNYLQMASSNYIIFTENGRFGLMDLKGKQVLQPIYRELGFVQDNLIIVGKENGKYSIEKVDGSSNPFKDMEFDILLRQGNYFSTMDISTGNYTIYDRDGNIIIEDLAQEFNAKGDFISILNDDDTTTIYFKDKILASNVRRVFTFIPTMVIFEEGNDIVIYRRRS